MEYHPIQVERIARRAFELARTRRGLVSSVDKANVLETSRLWRRVVTEAAAVTGGLGLAASASVGDDGPGIFEPVHGSAPDIAGRGVANPAAMLLSVALLLEHGLGRPGPARTLEAAVDRAVADAPTADLGGTATTEGFTASVLAGLT